MSFIILCNELTVIANLCLNSAGLELEPPPRLAFSSPPVSMTECGKGTQHYLFTINAWVNTADVNVHSFK